MGEPIEKADADFVREKTGFAIGGVPPVGHLEPIYTIVDEELLRLVEIWAAAGTPNSVFRLTGELLLEMTSGVPMSVKWNRQYRHCEPRRSNVHALRVTGA